MISYFRIQITIRFWAPPTNLMDELLPWDNLFAEREARHLHAYDPGFPHEEPPAKPVQPVPTDVPAPEPRDVPAPEPRDVPPPEPGGVPPFVAEPPKRNDNAKPRPVP